MVLAAIADDGTNPLEILKRVFEATSYAVSVTDTRPAIVMVNPAFTRVTGWSEAEVIGQNPSMLQSGRHDADFYRDMWVALDRSGHWKGEIWNRHKSGRVYPELLTIDAVLNSRGDAKYYVAVFADISRQKAAEQSLTALAYFDPLTGLPNRALIEDRLRQEVARAQRKGTVLAVQMIDLDGFKQVNDTHGHDVGDVLLQKLGARLANAVRGSDTVGRLGGDEFVMVCPDVGGRDGARSAADRILRSLAEPERVDGIDIVPAASIGISLYPRDGHDTDSLVAAADSAMYCAKRRGKARAHFFSDGCD